MIEPVERWIVCVTGFMQPEGRVTGVESLQDELHRQCLCKHTRVILKAWCDSPWHIAERIWNRRPYTKPPKVVLIGYSWGGFTANKIAWELRDRGIPVEAMVLCDPVWRSRTWAFRWLSMLDCWSILVPENVETLYTWRQVRNQPSGAHLLLQNKDATNWKVNVVRKDVTHQYIDDDPHFHNVARRVACPELAA